jgi:arylformamidase
MSKLYDVSMPLREGMPVWPGNPPFERRVTHVIGKDGSPVNQSQLVMGAHCGTHIDAPWHFEADGFAAQQVPLENLVGPARLLHFPAAEHVTRALLEPLDWNGVERVLFRTRNSDHWARGGAFDPGFCSVAPDAARFLVEKRVKLVGIDSLGIERFGSTDFGTHHALLREGITVVEGLYLIGAPPGDYILFCGSLRVERGDGAPARVLLLDPRP